MDDRTEEKPYNPEIRAHNCIIAVGLNVAMGTEWATTDASRREFPLTWVVDSCQSVMRILRRYSGGSSKRVWCILHWKCAWGQRRCDVLAPRKLGQVAKRRRISSSVQPAMTHTYRKTSGFEVLRIIIFGQWWELIFADLRRVICQQNKPVEEGIGQKGGPRHNLFWV